MIILALETSAKVAGAAIWQDGRLLGENYLDAGLTHSQTILPLAGDLLAAARMVPAQIDIFACAAGPGSFTGLRIGIGAIKGMAMATGKPCAAVSTLEALAWNLCGFSGVVVPAMDARRKQVYTAVFDCNGSEPERLWPDTAISVSDLGKKLAELGEPVTFVGDGAVLCHNELKESLPGSRLAPPNLLLQRAGSVAAVAHGMALRQELVTAADLAPVYLRLPQAERERLEKVER